MPEEIIIDEPVMKDEKKITTEEAQKVIEAERQERIKACSAEIRASLEKHKCVIETLINISAK
jgi:hypothetical protein